MNKQNGKTNLKHTPENYFLIFDDVCNLFEIPYNEWFDLYNEIPQEQRRTIFNVFIGVPEGRYWSSMGAYISGEDYVPSWESEDSEFEMELINLAAFFEIKDDEESEIFENLTPEKLVSAITYRYNTLPDGTYVVIKEFNRLVRQLLSQGVDHLTTQPPLIIINEDAQNRYMLF